MSMTYYDENNNEQPEDLDKNCVTFVERHLDLNGDDFLIIPNGGSGDCMFKAVSQAAHQGDESKHRTIRKNVVDFIINQRWEKFNESIEVQHINGNNLLQRQWAKNPKHAYKMYMSLAGTLGSSSELTAAGELYNYNFATIQEYCSPSNRTYRVENCIMYHDTPEFHYFFFTGDYDNGHWEYIKNLSNVKLEDGTYHGRHKTIIEGDEINVEEWLARETLNNNDADRLKIPTERSLYRSRRTLYPFDLSCFNFGRNGTVSMNGSKFTIASVESTDLFSVLAQECLQNEESAQETELVLMKHRYSYFEEVNYKLITQPWSHNFTTEAIKYCGHACKGNIQDLISAADLYSFSFILFMKLNDDDNDDMVHECKFTHVDRWGGESDRLLYFFMRLVPLDHSEVLVAKWWRLIKAQISSGNLSQTSLTKTFRQSKDRLRSAGNNCPTSMKNATHLLSHIEEDEHCPELVHRQSIENFLRETASEGYSGELEAVSPPSSKKNSRPGTPRPKSVPPSLPRERSGHRVMAQILETTEANAILSADAKNSFDGEHNVANMIYLDDEDLDTDDCLQKDYVNIFGSSPKSSLIFEKKALIKNTETRLVKNKLNPEKVKPATDADLLKHPHKVRTVVKMSDRNGSRRDIVYRGNGYMEVNDVLADLGTQGLIRLPIKPTSAVDHYKTESVEETYKAIKRQYSDNPFVLRDENFNLIPTNDAIMLDRKTEADSDVSFEKFGPGAYAADLEQKQSPRNTQFLSPEFTSHRKSSDNGNIWRNKVSPSPRELPQHFVELNCKVRESSEKLLNNGSTDKPKKKRCFSKLVAFIVWIFTSARKITRCTRKGIRERYTRYHESKTLFKISKTQSQHQPMKSTDEFVSY